MTCAVSSLGLELEESRRHCGECGGGDVMVVGGGGRWWAVVVVGVVVVVVMVPSGVVQRSSFVDDVYQSCLMLCSSWDVEVMREWMNVDVDIAKASSFPSLLP